MDVPMQNYALAAISADVTGTLRGQCTYETSIAGILRANLNEVYQRHTSTRLFTAA